MKPKFISETDWHLLKEKYPETIDDIIKKLNEHYPVQYLIGDVDFCNCKIKVDERVLIPRYETEFLVQKTIEKIKKKKILIPKILELGTGSGCISIALKKRIDCEIRAVDISKEALDLAKENAAINKVHINFAQKDMLNISYEQYDVLISNPPYVSFEEPVGIETKYEPQIALFAEKNGTYFYEEILKKVQKTKQKPKLIAFEIGAYQKEEIKKLTKKYLSTYTCQIEKDLAGKDRYAFLSE